MSNIKEYLRELDNGVPLWFMTDKNVKQLISVLDASETAREYDDNRAYVMGELKSYITYYQRLLDIVSHFTFVKGKGGE